VPAALRAPPGAVRFRGDRGFESAKSDFDFSVQFGPLGPGAYADAYFGLREALEELCGRPVDLVVASAVKNPYFQRAVDATKTLLYAA
jgi:predicted nucleotidyltransferase